MADTSSDFMEIEDSSESAKSGSIHTEKNGVSEDEIKHPKSTPEPESEAIEIDTVDKPNLDNVDGDDLIPIDDQEDSEVNASEVNSKVDDPKTNGTVVDGSVEENQKEPDDVPDEENQKEPDDVPDEEKSEAMEVGDVATSPSTAVSEEKPESEDSLKPKSVTDVLAETPPKDSPEVILSNLSPFVKDRCDLGESSRFELGESSRCDLGESSRCDLGESSRFELGESSKDRSGDKEDEKDSKVDVPDNKDEAAKAGTSGSEPKEKSKSGKKKKNKICAECGMKKKLPLRIVFQGQMCQLCSDVCFDNFKKKKVVKAPIINNENCGQCQKKIETGKPGYFPAIGEVMILCSVECVAKYHEKTGKPKKCNHCKKMVESVYNRLSWETMTFCNEDCLLQYQSQSGSHCTCCQSPVPKASLGKYSVCFGADIRQFCAANCLEEFKKGLKVCSYCQTDLSSVGEGFLAPVGDKGQFKDFCTQKCMERYELMNNMSKTIPEAECAHCKRQGTFRIQAKHEDKTYALCCDTCVAAFRCSNQITMNMCGTCFKFFLPPCDLTYAFTFESTPRHFCTKACMTLFVLSNRKIIQCAQCKVKKYNFDMIEKIETNNHANFYCSLNCLSTYRLNQTLSAIQKVRCDHCTKTNQAQYHLTMSDGTIRNFCHYDCVVSFQKECMIASFPQPNRGPVNPKPTPTTSILNSPVISNVVSLAPARPSASPQRNVVPQTLVSVRPQGPTLSVLSPKPSPSTSSQATPTSTLTISQSNNFKEYIVRPPSPRTQRNKGVTVKPMMQTKGVCVRQQTCHKAVQTDETRLPAILPIPFPVYFPSPVQYTRTVTVPMPFPVPVPIPIPIFMKDKSPSKSSQAQLLNVATKSAECLKVIEESNKNLCQRLGISTDVASTSQGPKETTNSIPEAAIQPDPSISGEKPTVIENNTPAENNTKATENSTVSAKNGTMLTENSTASTENSTKPTENSTKPAENSTKPAENSTESAENSTKSAENSTKAAENSTKAAENSTKLAENSTKPVENSTKPGENSTKPTENNTVPTPVENSNSLTENNTVPIIAPKIEPMDEEPPVETKPPRRKKRSGEDLIMNEVKRSKTDDELENSYGINAWRQWIAIKNGHVGRGPKKFKSFKTDILTLTPAELNSYLSLFVKEVQRPNGQAYTAGALFYLLLGIQQYLNDNNRTDDLFSDEEFGTFAEHFHDVLLQYESRALHGDVPWSRIKEEFLWESRQLGAQSPQILLNTLIYFNTKYFKMRTNTAHFNFNFNNIKRHTDDTGSYLRYHAVQSSEEQNEDRMNALTQPQNRKDQLRCPVSPKELIFAEGKFYLTPEKNCTPDSGIWYAEAPLNRAVIAKTLQRSKLVEDIFND